MHRFMHYVKNTLQLFLLFDLLLLSRGQFQGQASGSAGLFPNGEGPLRDGASPPLFNNNGNVRPNRDDDDDGDNAGDESSRNPIPKINLPKSALPGRRRGAIRSKGVCRDGWKLAEMNNVPICIYVNHKELSWDEAKDSCRQDFGFLLKAEAPVYVDSKSIGEYLRRQEIRNIWTGLHEEEGTLVWDELAPHKVRPYNDFMESRLEDDRTWDWEIDDATDDSDICGDLDLSRVKIPHQEEILNRRRKRSKIRGKDKIRKRRNPEENPQPEMAFSQLLSETLTKRPIDTVFQNTERPPQRPFRQYGSDSIRDTTTNSETDKPFQDLAFLKDIQPQEDTQSQQPEQQQHNLYGQNSEWQSTSDFGEGKAVQNPVFSEKVPEKQVHITKISKPDITIEQQQSEGTQSIPDAGNWNSNIRMTSDLSSIVPTSGLHDSRKNLEDITNPPNDDGDSDTTVPTTMSSQITMNDNNEVHADVPTPKPLDKEGVIDFVSAKKDTHVDVPELNPQPFVTKRKMLSDDTQQSPDVEMAPPTPDTQEEILRTLPVTKPTIDKKEPRNDFHVKPPSEKTDNAVNLDFIKHAEMLSQTTPSMQSSPTKNILQRENDSDTIAPSFSFIPTVPTSDDVTPVNDDVVPTTNSNFDDVTTPTPGTVSVTGPANESEPMTGATQISIPDMHEINTAPTSRGVPIRRPPTVKNNDNDDVNDDETIRGRKKARKTSKFTTVDPSFDFTSPDPFINTLGIIGKTPSKSNTSDSSNTTDDKITSGTSSEYLKTTKDDPNESESDSGTKGESDNSDSDSKDGKDSETDSNDTNSKSGSDDNDENVKAVFNVTEGSSRLSDRKIVRNLPSNTPDRNGDNYDDMSNGIENESIESVENTTLIDDGKKNNSADDKDGSYHDSNEFAESKTASNSTDNEGDGSNESTTVIMKHTPTNNATEDTNPQNDNSKDSASSSIDSIMDDEESKDNTDNNESQKSGDSDDNDVNISKTSLPDDPTEYDKNGGERLETDDATEYDKDRGGEIIEPDNTDDNINDKSLGDMGEDTNSTEGSETFESTETGDNDVSTQNVIGILSTTNSGTDDVDDDDDKKLSEINEDNRKDRDQRLTDKNVSSTTAVSASDEKNDNSENENDDTKSTTHSLNDESKETTARSENDDARSSDGNIENTTSDDNEANDEVSNRETTTTNDKEVDDDFLGDKSVESTTTNDNNSNDDDVLDDKNVESTTTNDNNSNDDDVLDDKSVESTTTNENNSNDDDDLDDSVDSTTTNENNSNDDDVLDDSVDSATTNDNNSVNDDVLDDKSVESTTMSDNNSNDDDVLNDESVESTTTNDNESDDDVVNDKSEESTATDGNDDNDDVLNDKIEESTGSNGNDGGDDDNLNDKSEESTSTNGNKSDDDDSNDKSEESTSTNDNDGGDDDDLLNDKSEESTATNDINSNDDDLNDKSEDSTTINDSEADDDAFKDKSEENITVNGNDGDDDDLIDKSEEGTVTNSNDGKDDADEDDVGDVMNDKSEESITNDDGETDSSEENGIENAIYDNSDSNDDISSKEKESKENETDDDDDTNEEKDDKVTSIPIDLELMESIQEADEMSATSSEDIDISNENDDLNDIDDEIHESSSDSLDDSNSDNFDDINEIDSVVIPTTLVARKPAEDDQEEGEFDITSEEKVDDREDSDDMSSLGDDVPIGDFMTLRTFVVEEESDDIGDDLRSNFAGKDTELRINEHLGPFEEIEEFVPPADKREHILHSNQRHSHRKALGMKLSQCNIRKPSVCYSPPIVLEDTASSCPPGWYGHIFSKKCYKVIISRMPFSAALERCKNEGGRLASMGNSKFNADLVLMSILKSQTEGFVVGPSSTFWVQRLPSTVQCRALTVNGYMETSCNSPAEVVCERDSLLKGQDQEYDADDDDDEIEDDEEILEPERVYFSSKNENSKLQCGLINKNKELPTIWFKDGKIVDIKLERRSPSLVSLLGVMGRPLTPLPEPALTTSNALELGPMFRKTLEYSSSQKLTNEMFQGNYWCEVWEMHPFNRRRSRPYSVKYSDVITFRGTIEMPDMSHQGIILHNMINQQDDKLSNIIKDINYISDKILPVLQKNIPTIQSVTTYGGKIEDTQPLTLGYYTFLKTIDNYTMADENMAYLLLRKELRKTKKNTQMLLTLPGKTPLHIVRSIDFTSTIACPLDHLKDEVTGLIATFPRSSIDTKVSSIEMCEGSVAGHASCKGDYETGAYWTDISVTKTCNNESHTQSEEEQEEEEGMFEKMTVEARLKELAEMDMEDENVEGIMEETASIVEKVEEMTALDVDYIADIMDKTVKVQKITKAVGINVLKTMDKVMSIDEDEIEKANDVSKASNRILKSFEKVAENIYLEDDGKLRIVTPNVALEVWKLKQMKKPIIGLAARQAKGGRLDEVLNEDRIFTIYNQTQLYGDIDAAIELPSELIASEMIDGKGIKDDTRLFMMVYRDGRLFRGNSKGSEKIDVTSDLRLGVLNSYIISASISGRQIKGLKQKVKTVFKPLQSPANDERKCAFWDFELNNEVGGWSTAGCMYNGQANGRDICLCDHLTNFAVLIDFYGQAEPVDPDHDFSLSIISLVGLSLSILGLSLTIISYVFFRKLRQGRAQQTLFNLALAMLCSWVVFLTGIRQTHNFIGCIIVAVLLHYFILSSFMWMLMEAFLQYLTFVKVLGTYVTRYTLKTVVIAWGLPLIPIIVVLSLDPNLYRGGDRYCWMSLEAFYYAFALPIGIIILCNLVVFILTVSSICRRPTGLRSNQSKQKIAITNLQAAITSFVLLGLTWLLGYLAIADARVVFQYAFTILNSLQGFFIFVLFVARKKQVRDQWLIVCCCKDPKMEKALRSLSASASIPSTCSGRSSGSYSGRSDRSDSTRTTSSFVNHDYETIYTVPYSKHSRESLYYRKV